MGEVQPVQPVLLVMALFSRYAEALAWAREQAAAKRGPIALASEAFEHNETTYYQREMGPGLRKQFLAFTELFDPGELPRLKHETNLWEQQYATQSPHPEPRPLNLDPGYLTEAKLVLATTKDRDHRIYIGDGMFAEITLYYRGGEWRVHRWTYPDYHRADYHAFFSRCRDWLRERRRG